MSRRGEKEGAKGPVETIRVEMGEDGMRLDRWFKGHYPAVGHVYLQKLLRTGQVRLDSRRAEAGTRIAAGQEIRVPAIVRLPAKERAGARPPASISSDDRALIESIILYEDDDVLVLDKPFGLAVQGGTSTRRHIDGMLAAMADRFGDRPRLVHRLDRDTTGVLLVAKHRQAAARLGRTFQTRAAAKTYWALVKGVPKPAQGRIEAALVKASGPGGDRVRRAEPGEQDEAMHATTHYSVIDRAGHKIAWVSLKPVTGRQHQLRAHMALIGCPIVGDSKYEGGVEAARLVADQHSGSEVALEPVLHLHARRLQLPHPLAAGRKLDITAPLPAHMHRSFTTLGFDPDRFDAERE